MNKSRKKKGPAPSTDLGSIKDFLDMIAPSVIDFKVDHFLCGNTYRCVWALREYPTSTDEQAILRHLGEMDGVTIRIYTRQVTASEEKRIIHNAANKNRMSRSSTEDLQQTVTAEANLQDVVNLVSTMHRNREPLLHCAVFLELTASSYDALKLLQTDVLTELVRSKLNVDRLLLRQREGFVSVMPSGWNHFGEQFERVLPASSVANLYPFNYSGKTDPHGFYIGKDKYGANILVDFDKRDDDKTSASILILGNSGQGKSYLLKLLLLNFLEAGKSVISLDVEHEQKDMCERVGGCFIDLMGGMYRINPLEPKCWDEGGDPEDTDAPEAFRKSTRLSQHVSFLKDFFRAYKDFSDRHIDTIEIMVGRLYEKWGISDATDFSRLNPQDYPILSDLYDLIEQEYQGYDADAHHLYTAELLQEILLGLHSMCKGAEAKFFNGHTNVTSSRFIVFGVKGLLQANRSVRGAMLFNILSFMSDRILTLGNTTAVLDELYVWLSDNITVGTTIIEYIRNILKRVRKKESNLIMASQNLEDFDRDGIRELTKPLFAIPPHQFIFNCGSIDKRFYMDLLQLEEAEYNLIRFPQRGVCLFKCGNERYLLEVHAPAYKEALYGSAGGR
ncbi:VirB4 family type IV secretion system protein [Agathobaculum sp. Marseille-P7918]|uniref:VirB4 family type IV secretion system protein n=1 Tax=Agathobaculum sp. Marseille-P7918 TaxID=2479843 RepID=UPI0035673EEF